MHTEHVSIPASVLSALRHPTAVAVGTTSVRTLESLYWYGCLLAEDKSAPFDIPQYVYKEVAPISKEEALEKLTNRMKQLGCTSLRGRTALYVAPWLLT